MLHSEEELNDLLSRVGLTALKYKNNIGEPTIDLDTDDINIFVNYAKSNQIQHIFYRYDFCDELDYDLDEWLAYEEKEADLLKIAKKDIAEYKRQVNAIDLSQPVSLSLLCVHEGVILSLTLHEPWKKELVYAEQFVNFLKKKYRDKLLQLQVEGISEKQKNKDKTLEELKNLILSDPEFAKCTNQSLRYSYIRNLLNRPENSRFSDMFLSGVGEIIWREARNFAETVYFELKNKNRE